MTVTMPDRQRQYRDQAQALWPGEPPGGVDGAEYWNANKAQLTGVQQPSITWFPAPQPTSDAAVIVAPGGGYRFLSLDREGWAIAEVLNLAGINAAVLSYRHAGHGVDDPLPPRIERGVMDAYRAVRTLRHGYGKFAINPNNIGILGLSAGGLIGHLAGSGWGPKEDASDDDIADQPWRPNHVGMIYSAPRIRIGGSHLAPIDDEFPRCFLTGIRTDELQDRTLDFANELWQKNADCEVHVFTQGDHGHGLDATGSTALWLDLYVAWLTGRRST